MIGPSKSKQKFFISIIFLSFFLFSLDHAFAITKPHDTVTTLIPKIKAKVKQYPNLTCGIYIKPNWFNSSININGDSSFSAASLIKIPIAVALLLEVDKNKVSWNKVLILKRNHYAAGTGYLRARKAGTKIRLKEVFKLMLTISDNTATNMIIDLLGGVGTTNEKISRLGLRNTKLVSYLGDFTGTNKTSPHDLVNILERSLEGNLLSDGSKQIFRNTLLSVKNTSLIRKGLGRYTRFAHKTGTIGISVGDAGIIYLPFGKRIGISIIVRRPFNSLQGKTVIREISKLVYKSLA